MDSSTIQQVKSRMGIAGTAPQIDKAVNRALRVAPTDLSVLVTGESGAGKEFFPRIIHQYSPRKHARYIAVNCGAIPEGTIDSELFGHEKGSFTGAVNSRKGYFEEANGGTIFLDEVAELPLTTQARLLRVLETGEFLKVGSSQVQKTDIRVVAATNVDLQQAVARGRFREDLYYRLSSVQITVAPLRDRGTDILLLARKFAADFAEQQRTPHLGFSDEARRMLLSYRWPGNVRQLKNVVEQLALFEAGTTVEADTLAEYLPAGAETTTPAITREQPMLPACTSYPDDHTYEREREMLFSLIFNLKREQEKLRGELDELRSRLHTSPARFTPDTPYSEVQPVSLVKLSPAAGPEASEKELIRSTLEKHMGRRRAAAEELGISERTLYRKIKDYGIE